MLKKILSYSVGLYAVSLVASFVRIAVKSLVTKTIGKDGLGAYAYYMAVIAVASSLLAFGIRRAITKQVAASKDESTIAPLVVAVMALGAGASLLLAALGVSLHGVVDPVYALVLFSVGPFTIFEVARSTLRGQLDQKREIIAALAGVLVQAGCVVVMVLISRDAYAPVWGLAISNVLLAVGIIAYFVRRYPRQFRPGPVLGAVQSPAFHGLLALSAPLWVTDIFGIIGQQADQFIVQGQLGYTALAEYAAAFTFIGLLDQPITVMSRVFLVSFSGGHFNDLDRYKLVSSMNLALFSLLGFLVMAAAGPLTPILFAENFTLTPLLVAVLSVSSIFNSVEVLNTSLTIASDFPQANRNAKIVTTVLYIPVLFLLVARFGALGAAVSNVISWGGYAVVHALYMRRRLPEHAAYSLRALLLGAGLYIAGIWAAWMFQNTAITLLIALLYVGVGHLVGLWDLRQIPALARQIIPARVLSGVMK